MKRFKIAKVLSLAFAAVFAVSVFTTNAFAATNAETHKRDLTAEEIALIATVFDADYYAKQCPDVVDALGTSDAQTLFAHFLGYGLWEERQPNAQFNVDVYATRNVDLHKAFGDDIVAYYVHYASHPEEQAGRGISTLGDAMRRHAAVYSVYDFVVGQEQPREGAMKIQTENATQFDNMSDNDIISYWNDEGILANILAQQ